MPTWTVLLLWGCAARHASFPGPEDGSREARWVSVAVTDAAQGPNAERLELASRKLREAGHAGPEGYVCDRLVEALDLGSVQVSCDALEMERGQVLSVGKRQIAAPADGTRFTPDPPDPGQVPDVVLLVHDLQVSTDLMMVGTVTSAQLAVSGEYVLWDNEQGRPLRAGLLGWSEAISNLKGEPPLTVEMAAYRVRAGTFLDR